MKDPAFLFYPSDFISGTQYFTLEEKGAYIQLLLLQFSEGKLTDFLIRRSLGEAYERTWEVIKCKFAFDGEYYQNERLESEKQKRAKFTESRRNNLKSTPHMDKHMVTHMDKHMEDVNININEDIIKTNNIPELSEFLAYCKTLSVYHSSMDFQIEAKYNAWNENKWKDGNNKQIKNWKTKIQNTIPYFRKDYNGSRTNQQRRKDYVTKDEYKSELKSLYEGGS